MPHEVNPDGQHSAFNRHMWQQRAAGGYEQLGWVTASAALEKVIAVANLQGHEVAVDVGTGSQAVLSIISSQLHEGGKAYGFDISHEMLLRGPRRVPLFVADAHHIPLPSQSTDLLTARMVYHHLEDIEAAIHESHRLLKPGGKLIVGEYVAVDDEVWQFERRVFDIKESGRHLWTGEELSRLVQHHWPANCPVSVGYGTIPQYSVKDWMGKSGLPQDTQDAVCRCYLDAPESITRKMNISLTNDNDALVDRLFAFVLALKGSNSDTKTTFPD